MATKKRYSDINKAIKEAEAGRVHTKRRYFSPQRKYRKFCRDKSHARYLFSLRKHLREIASNRRGRLIEKREVLIWQ